MKNPFKKKTAPEAPPVPTMAELTAEVQHLSVGLVQRLRAINKMNRDCQGISARLDELDNLIKQRKELDNAKDNHAAKSGPETK